MFEALTNTSASSEEDDEELGSKLPRRSTGLFATLNTPPTAPTKHDEDEDDEQLPRTAPRPNPFSQLPKSSFKPASSRFGKPDDLKSSVSKSPSSDWRSKLPSQKDTDEDKESIKYESIDDEIVYEDIDDIYSEDEEYYDDDE